MKLITENTDALGAAVKLIFAKGVRKYIVLAGKESYHFEIGAVKENFEWI